MEGNSSIEAHDLEVNTVVCTDETTDLSKTVIDIVRDKAMEENVDDGLTCNESNQHAFMPDKTIDRSSIVDIFLEDSDNNSSEPKSIIQAASEKNIELDSVDAATEAKLLDEGDNDMAAENAASTAEPLSQNKSGDADDYKLWYDSDDDTMGAENISSAIAILTDDMTNVDSVDAVTEEKLLADAGDITIEDKHISPTVGPSVGNITEHDSTSMEKIKINNMDDNAMEVEDNSETVSPLSENKGEKSLIEEKVAEKPIISEAQSVDTLEENFNKQIDSSKTEDAAPSEKRNFNTELTNEEKSPKAHGIDVTEESLLDTKLNSENPEKSVTDEVMEELDEEELLSENQENIIDKTEKIDMIGQSIKAVLETGKSSTLCKDIEEVESFSDSLKEKVKAGTITKDISGNIKTLDSLEDSTSISEAETTIDKINDPHDINSKTDPNNKEILQSIDKEEFKSNKSLSDIQSLDIKTNEVIQENITDVETKIIPENILDQDNIVLTKESCLDIDSSNSIGNDNTLLSINSGHNIDNSDKRLQNIQDDNEEHTNTETVNINEDIQIDTDIQIDDKTKKDTDPDSSSKADISIDADSSANMSTDLFPIHKKSSHNLHLPDVMLEIPTQELIDIDDVLDSPNDSRIDELQNSKTDDTHEVEANNLKTINDIDKNESNCLNNTSTEKKDLTGPVIEDAIPSTSTAYKPDTFDDLPETSDSLGLLAEARRVQDDDEDEDDGVNDDDDLEHDESSNQMTGDHSEDSNAHQSETDGIKDEEDKDKEELDDKVSNESDADFDEYTEEQTNLDVEIEEHSVATLVAEVDEEDKADLEEEDKAGLEDDISEAVDNTLDDTQASENQCKVLDVNEEITKDNDKDNSEILKDVQKIEDVAFTLAENTDNIDLTLVTDDAVKGDTSKDVEKVKDTIEIDVEKEKDNTEKDSVSKDSTVKEVSAKETDTEMKLNEKSKNVKEDEDVVDQTPDIPTYNLSDSDNEDDVTAGAVHNDNKRKTTDNTLPPCNNLVSNKKIKVADVDVKVDDSSTNLNEHVVSIVDLQESSEEESDKSESQLGISSDDKPSSEVTNINLPTDIVVTSTGSTNVNTPGIVKTQEKIVISRVRKPSSQKSVTRLNTSEVTIKTSSSAEQQTLVIPEKQMQTGQAEDPTEPKVTPIYSIDSDEEESKEQAEPKKKSKCINNLCSSGAAVYRTTDNDIILYYDASRKRRPLVCKPCVDAVLDRRQSLIDGIKNMVPLSQLDMGDASSYPVEILDSDSEDEEPKPQEEPAKEAIGENAAKFLEENLAEMLNSTWKKYNLDERLKETEHEINAEISKFELESKEINDMLNECQKMTDKLRTDLYATFAHRIQSEPPLLIYETPKFRYIGLELGSPVPPAVPKNRHVNKRKLPASSSPPSPAKRPSVIPLGYTPLNDPILKVQESKTAANNSDDDKDVSVVKLSAESPPPDLPPPGELSRPPLRIDMPVYAMKNAFGPWLKGRITEIMPKGTNSSAFTSCRVQFDHITKNNNSKVLPARCIAYPEPPNVRLTIGTRLIALFKDSNKDSNKRDSFSSGVVAEAPTPVNNFRYLVFFDDGYAQYVKHPFTRLVCECSNLVWEEVHPFSRDFVKEYLMAFPERPMVRLHQGQNFKTEWNGKWWASRVVQVDASLVQVVFTENGRKEWIYRGSTRLAPLYVELQAAERHRTRASGTRRQPPRNNMPYVEYTRSEEQDTNKIIQNLPPATVMTLQQQKEELRKQRAVAKKSTTMPAGQPGTQQPGNKPATEIPDSLTSRVVYYTPKNAVRPYKLVPHQCSPQCKRSVLSLEDLRTYNPLAKPLLSGWERQTVRYKGQKEVMYRAPCGRRLRNMKELHRYLQVTESELSVDLFDFYYGTHCLAEFQIYKCLTGKKDLSQGRENVPIPCVNYYDHTLPEFCSYNTERTPTSGVPLNLDPEFLCGCDCTDDCEDKTKCACWKMTLEGARTIGLDSPNIGYEYKRLPEPLPSGIYECNSRCKCKNTCLNRVAQHPLQLKLQVFKTLNRGWGIRALNDVPKGAFLCVYAGNLLTDATANLDGLNEGDEYLAELDYIEVVEQMKDGYEADIPEEDKKLDAEQSDTTKQDDSPEESSSSSEEEETTSRYDKEDDDFKPAHNVAPEVAQFSKHLRKRSRDEEKADKEKEREKDKDKTDDNFITISDDEEAREPSRFAAQTGMDGNEFISKHRSVRSYFGEDEACYIMDAKVQGNIGRYLNHSCSPNVFVQNVFVDTHDPRFPWVAFFALSHIKAGTELTWNYNYDVGSVPDKVLYCYCQAPNCRGRLL